MLALWGRIIVHICLWNVSMVFMRWWPLGSATSMSNIYGYFPWLDMDRSYTRQWGKPNYGTWICIVNTICFYRQWSFWLKYFIFWKTNVGFWYTLLVSVLMMLNLFSKLLYMRNDVSYYIMFSLKTVVDMSTHWDTKSHSFRFYFPFSGRIRICSSCLPLLQDFEDF